ncbi:MAG: glycosyltransferase family 2 protein [Micrococcales bacterium]|nr:glycosyltransferase family 2 protein [Micrococcales bacterium]
MSDSQSITLSICIPTYNRPALLIEALHSIVSQVADNSVIEICISNNCSTEDYSVVEQFIYEYHYIQYQRHRQPITLDENMHSVVKMAKGSYIYFLGDDDYFLENGLVQLLEAIKDISPDLAIINGTNVDKDGRSVGRLFDGGNILLYSFKSSYTYHHNHCMFGAILVRRSLLLDYLFVSFYGTSHAYMSFWAAIALHESCDQNSNKPIKVFTPPHPIVALRASSKTYSAYFLDAMYLHMPMWYFVLLRFVQCESNRLLVMRIANDNTRLIFSLRFLASLKKSGLNVRSVANYPPAQLTYVIRLKILLIVYTPTIIMQSAGKLIREIKSLRDHF